MAMIRCDAGSTAGTTTINVKGERAFKRRNSNNGHGIRTVVCVDLNYFRVMVRSLGLDTVALLSVALENAGSWAL